LTVWGFPGYDKENHPERSRGFGLGKGKYGNFRSAVYKKPVRSWMYSEEGYTIFMQLMISDLERFSSFS